MKCSGLASGEEAEGEEAHRLMYLTDGGEEIAGAGSSLKAHLPVDLPSDQKIAMTGTSDQSEFPL